MSCCEAAKDIISLSITGTEFKPTVHNMKATQCSKPSDWMYLQNSVALPLQGLMVTVFPIPAPARQQAFFTFVICHSFTAQHNVSFLLESCDNKGLAANYSLLAQRFPVARGISHAGCYRECHAGSALAVHLEVKSL